MKDTAKLILEHSTYGAMKANTMISITRSDWNSDFLVTDGKTRNKKSVKRKPNSNVVFRFAKGTYSSCKSKKLN